MYSKDQKTRLDFGKEEVMEQKRVNRRDFLRGAAMVAGATALAACSTPGEQPGSGQPAGGDQVTIVQYYHQYGEEGTQQAAKKYADSYSEVNSKVKVDMQWIPGDYEQKLNAALLTEQAPDVFEHGPNAAYVNAGQVVALDDLFPDDIKKDFDPKVIERNSWKGKIYSVQMIVDTGALYCRKSVLDAAGVKPPQTLDELIDAATKLSDNKTKGLFLGNDGIGGSGDMSIYAGGGALVDQNKVVFNTDRAAEGLMKIKALNEANVLLIGAPTDWWDPGSLTSGLAAMQWCGLWAMPGIRKAINDDFYVTAFPKLDDQGSPATFLGGWSEFVNAKGKHIDESKAFTKWLWIDNTDAQKDWSLSYGFHVPPRMSAAASADPLKSGAAKEVMDIVNQYGKDAGPYMTNNMWTSFNNAVANIIKNGADPKTELDAAAQACQTELDKVLA